MKKQFTPPKKKSNSPRVSSGWLGWLFVLFFLSGGTATFAQSSLSIAKRANVSSVPSGQTFYYTVQYACSSPTTPCNDVVVRDSLAAGLTYLGNVGSVHTTSSSYNSTSRIVTFNFGTLASGSTGELQITVKFPEGTTPNGTVVKNRAAIFATNAATVTSNTVSVTATAVSKWEVDKQITTSSFIDFDVSYKVALCSPNAGNLGGLNLQNARLVDTLPLNAVFVSASNSGVYDAINRTVTWNLGSIGVTNGGCTSRTVTVQYPSTVFSNGQTVVNRVEGFGTPYGLSDQSLGTDQVSHVLSGFVPSTGSTLNKYVDFGEKVVGQVASYTFNLKNSSNVAVNDFVLEDAIPVALDVTEITSGGYPSAAPVNIWYKTNLNSSYALVPGSPFSSNSTVLVSAMGLGSSEVITHLKWDWGTVAVGFAPSSTALRPGLKATLLATDRNGNAVNTGSIVQNCGSLGFVYNGNVTNRNACVNVEVIDPMARPYPYKEETTTGPYLPGSTVGYRLRVRNYGLATHKLDKPVLMDLLPESQVFVDGSWTYDAGNAGMAAPVFEKLENYAGSGRTLLRWSWTDAVPVDAAAYISFNAQVKPGTIYGALPNKVQLTSNVGNVRCPATKETDTLDLDGDGSKSDQICNYTHTIQIQGVPALSANKLVKGEYDDDFHKYPEVGVSTPGGTADYLLQVKNEGNVPMNEAVLIDVLPAIGDQLVTTKDERKSEWRPNLIGAVAAPKGVTVYYSTVANPCTEELGTSKPDCEKPEWRTELPEDITSVRALKFDFAKVEIGLNETLTLSWPMRVPAGAPTEGEVAWNSFAYTATRADNGSRLLAAEPTKVGIALKPIKGIAIGSFFWLDEDRDGVQGEKESGLNGVKVTLIHPGGDEKPGTEDDKEVAFSYTGDDQKGRPGYYLFPNVEEGIYALRFDLPKGFRFTKMDAENDEIDSDINPESGYTEVFKASGASVLNMNGGAWKAKADLALKKGVDNPIAQSGQNVTYYIVVVNDGPDDATNVTVHDPLHSSLTYIASGTSQGAYNPSTGEWNIGTLPVGGQAELKIEVQLGKECLVYNIAQVTGSDALDPDSTPNNYVGIFDEDDVDVAVVNGCSFSSGGNNGGLESNGNLASAIATRNFNRAHLPGVETEYGPFNRHTEKQLNKRDALGVILDVIPQEGPLKSSSIVTTPKDLQGITNATSFFAVDYMYTDQRRVGAILANTTPDGYTYEHTKAICDRLNGATLEEMTTVNIMGQPFQMVTLRHPDGAVDYASWFVVYQTVDGFQVENQFRRAGYKPIQTGNEILNFQVWSVVPQFTKGLVEEILVALQKRGSLNWTGNLPQMPKVYVRKAQYASGKMNLEVVNLAGASSMTFNGTQARTESGDRVPFSQLVSLTNTEPGSVEWLEVPVNALYDIGFSISNEVDTATDELYLADGPWGASADPAGAQVARFLVKSVDAANTSADVYTVDRAVEISGQVKTWVAVFRSLQPNQRPTNLGAFNTLRFKAKGAANLKVVLEKAGIKTWDQYATRVSLSENEAVYELPFPSFRVADGTGRFRADDVTQLVFYVEGNGQASQAFDLSISDVQFVSGTSVAAENEAQPTTFALDQNYPNPFNPSTNIRFTLPESGKVALKVYDMLGRQVATLVNNELRTAGVHTITFDAANLPSGTYVYRLEVAGQAAITRKMIFVK
ncbi:MAG: DUF11 domain-containing protein [Bacteroidetes Order II. Incertae sedis bacterium]|nr:DUF11 domain-containing protein [Bacteroidetes Order II. bacterium]